LLEKQKPVNVDSKTPTTTNAEVPTTKNAPELKKADLSEANIKKLEKDIDPHKTNIDEVNAPKDKQVANGEKPPKSEILNDDPNIKDKDLDNLKKYEDEVDPSTKKKMEEDADTDVKKGKDHDSKAKALMMARVIAESNDKIDTPVAVLKAELAPLKAMKGVDDFIIEGGTNGVFQIYMIGSKYPVKTYTIAERQKKNDLDKRKKRTEEVPLGDDKTIRGFSNAGEYVERSGNLRNQLHGINGLEDANVGIRGSSVTGTSTKTGGPFRTGITDGKPSDLDFFFTSDAFEKQLLKAGLNLDEPISPAMLKNVDNQLYNTLENFATQTRQQVGRESQAYFLSKKILNNLSSKDFLIR
jgi:hypothetical protein